MKSKIVYQDGDYTKVIYGEVVQDEFLITVTQSNGRDVLIGKKAIISISPKEDF